MSKLAKIIPGAKPLTFKEFRNKGLVFAGGFKGFEAAQRKSTADEASRRAGAKTTTTVKNVLQTGQSASSKGRKFKTPTTVVETALPPTGQSNQITGDIAVTNKTPLSSQEFAEAVNKEIPSEKAVEDETLTPEQVAEQDGLAQEGIVEEGMKDVNTTAEQYGLESGEETIQGVVDTFKEEQVGEMTYAQRRVDQLNKLDDAGNARFNKQAEGAKGATKAAFGQSREGAMSGTASALRTEFVAEMDKRISEADLRLSMARAQRNKYILDLEKAQKAKQIELAETIQKSLSAAQVKIDNAKTDYLNALTKANQEARLVEASTQKSAIDILTALPVGSIESMDPEALMTFFGDNKSQALMIKGLDSARLSGQLSDPDYVKGVNEAMVAGIPQSGKEFLYYQNLLTSDPVAAQKYAVQIGIDESPTVQEEFENQIKWNKYALDHYKETGMWPSKNGTVNSDNSVDDNSPVGAHGGQCGEYVNNYLGAKLFGDSLKDKKQKINSDVPVAGGVFISKYGYNLATIGQTGHVGLITKVYDDDSFDIKDSNRGSDELIDTSHVTNPLESGIIGFFDPGKPASGWNPSGGELDALAYTPPIIPTGTGLGKQLTEKDAIMAQIKAGQITSTDVSKYRNWAKTQGWLDEFTKALIDPRIKALSVTDSTKYGVPAAITQYQLDEILAYREAQGLGNKTFQAFINDTATDQSGLGEHDKLVKFTQVRDNLIEAKELYAKLLKEGGGVSGWWDTTKRIASRGTESVLGLEQSDELDLFRQIEALTGEALVSFVKEISGVAVSEPEFQRLKKYKPNVDMTEGQFLRQLERSIEEIGRLEKAKAKRFGFSSVKQMRNVITGGVQSNPLPGASDATIPMPTQYTVPEERDTEANSDRY